MKVLFAQFNGLEIFFLLCAVLGGAFVFVRLAMQLMGIGHDVGLDGDGSDIDAHHSDSDVGFKVLSLHGLTSFLMMFGLVGLAMYRQSNMGVVVSIGGGFIAGAISVWVIKQLFSLILKLQSSGTIAIDHTIGSQGKVYLTIPDDGTGRVLVNVNNSLREYEAKSSDDRKIDTDTPIRVVWVDGNVLVVEKI